MTSENRLLSCEEEVQKLLEDTIVIDGLIQPEMGEHFLAMLRRSGVTALNWTVCMPWNPTETALLEIADALEFIIGHPNDVCLVRRAADIQTAKDQDRTGLILGLQNAKPAEPDLRFYRILHELGIRIIQLTHNDRNTYGEGCIEDANAGLSRLGRNAIAEMNRLGILLDLTHCGDRTTLEAIDASADSVVITHANSRTVCPTPRNKSDEALKSLAARGGVVGLCLWSPLVGSRGGGWPTLDDFIRHVDHVVSLIGVDHVGIGTDHAEGYPPDVWAEKFGPNGVYSAATRHVGPWYNYDTRYVQGLGSCVDISSLTAGIARMGFTNDELRAILGGNFFRLFQAVWKD